MPSLTQEQITQARETDLLDYLLSHESGVLKREGANYRHREHDSLVYVASKNYWYWNSRGRKINAVDYLMEIRGYSFVDAVERLAGCGTFTVSRYTASSSQEQKKTAKKKPFRLPWVKRCATFAISYLQRRGVHSDIIRRCMQLGLFYESRYNNEAVCVFVGRDDTGTGRFACVRGIAGDLKKDISGSDKRFSFCYPPDQPGSRHLAVFEAPIDALSHATLQKLEGWQWNGYRLSLGGTSHVALVAFLECHPEILSQLCEQFSDSPKAMEQRVRRAATAGLVNLANLGIEDYGNDAFTEYAGTLYHFEQVRREMDRLRTSFRLAWDAGYRKFVMFLHYPPTNILEKASPFTEIAEEYKVTAVVYSHCHGERRFGDSIRGEFQGLR